jgi:hypothetical protein
MTANDMNKPFEITSICRADLKEYYAQKDIESLTDSDMIWIAGKMADDYCNQLFWTSLRFFVDELLEDRANQ